jgi:hypothetical protein
MAAQPWTTRASQSSAQSIEPGAVSIATAGGPAVLAVAAAPDSQPVATNLQFGPTESRTQHANRVNRDLAVTTSLILSVFVLLRILMLWQRTHNRKKLVQINLNPPETKA